MGIEDLYQRELIYLREELRDLKDCQVTFVKYATTATALLLGIIVNLKNGQFSGIAYLLPLVILLPAWWIFFEKAKTITRIVGYYRVLEKLILKKISFQKGFQGWENAQSMFRDFERRGKLDEIEAEFNSEAQKNQRGSDSRFGKFIKLVTFQASPYWMLIYIIFLLLVLICFIMSYFSSSGYVDLPIYLPIIIIIILSAYWKVVSVWQLVWGRHSYDLNEYFWEKILKEKDAEVSNT